MGTTVHVSQLKAQLVDAVTGPAKPMAAAVKNVDAAMKALGRSSADVDRLNRSLDTLRERARRVDAFRSSLAGLSESRRAFREAQENVVRLAREMRNAESPTRSMTAAYRAAQQAVSAASAAFRAQRDAVLSAKAAMEQAGTPARRAAQAQQQLRRQITETNAALQQQRQRQSAAAPSGAGPDRVSLPTAGQAVDAAVGARAVGTARRTYERATAGWTEMDEAVRRQRAIMGFSERAQQPLMAQALRIGQETRFSNADVVRAQTTIGSGLPDALKDPQVIRSITEAARDYALAMRTTMDEGAEAIRARINTSAYDMSSPAAAERSSRHAANRLVQLAKMSGMDHNDVMGYTRFGTAPGRVAGFSEEFQDAMAANLRRVGFEGSMGGNFVRAAATKLSTPTRQALDALAAMGINYRDYNRSGSSFSAEGLGRMTRTTFGRDLNPEALARVREVFNDEDAVRNRDTFTTRLSEILTEAVARRSSRTGEVTAQDRERITKMIDRFHLLSSEGTDTERLMTDILRRGMTPAVARYLFGQEHGGRAQTLRAADVERDAQAIRNTPNNRARAVGDEIQGGAYGAYQRMIGSIETFYMRLGQANDKLLTFAWDKIGNAIDSIAGLPDKVLQLGTAAGVAATALMGIRAALAVKGFLSAGGAAAGGGAAAAAGAAASRAGAMRFLPGIGWVLGAAAVGGAVVEAGWGVSDIAGGRHYTPRSQEDIESLRARAAELETQIAGIRSRTHPSMVGAPNAQLSNLEGELANIRNRIEAGIRAGGEGAQRAAQDLGAKVPEGVAQASGAAIAAGAALGARIVDGIRAGAANSAAPVISGARADGGPVSAGRTYLVGERGPELFTPRQSGAIVPNGGGGGGRSAGRDVVVNVSLTVNANGGGNAAEIAATVRRELQTQVRAAFRGIQADVGLNWS